MNRLENGTGAVTSLSWSLCFPSFAVVVSVYAQILVWKELYYGSMSEKEKQQLVSEVNILRELNHKHVVRYFDRIIDREKKKIYIVMEFCSGGDLASMIKANQRAGTCIEEEFIWKLLCELAIALHECHRKANGTILHRDLKVYTYANELLGSGCSKYCVSAQ